jgi:hypothetical protein
MRFTVSLLSFCLVLAAGCSSMDSPSVPQAIREKFSGPTYQTHVFQADPVKVYAAAKAALKPMDFNFVSGGPNQRKLSAINDVTPATDIRAAHQITLDVKITSSPDGTEVAALFTDVIDDGFDRHPGMATSTPIDSTGIYENYFHHIEQALAAPVK